MKCTINGYEFSSDFDSGNLARVELVNCNRLNNQAIKPNSNSQNQRVPNGDNTHNLQNFVPDAEFMAWTRSDCEGTEFQNGNRTWFHFSVRTNHRNSFIKITIVNLNRQGKLFSYGMAPVYKEICNDAYPALIQSWRRIKDIPKYKSYEGQSAISFLHYLNPRPSTITYFAFTYPFSYTECQELLNKCDARFSSKCKRDANLYYHREVLCKSLNGNNMDLITISSRNGLVENLKDDAFGNNFMFPENDRCNSFVPSKKIIFITSETPSSHVFNGLLDFLLSEQEQAIALRQKYVFKMIPMLNPDGVINGHYRTDTRGVNLNRVYNNPSPVLHPTIYATRSLILHHHKEAHEQTNGGRVFLYVDLHGHASKRGCFIYGNHFDSLGKKIECMLFPKLLSINCSNFDFLSCNFSLKNMATIDRLNKTNKEGSGRVSIFRNTGLVKCYTLECNYNSGKADLMTLAFSKSNSSTQKYTPETYSEVGKAIGISILDLTDDNTKSNLPLTNLRNLEGVKQWLSKYIRGGFSSKKFFSPLKAHSSSPTVQRATSLIASSSKKLPTMRQRSLSMRLARSGSPRLAFSANSDSLPGTSYNSPAKRSSAKSNVLTTRMAALEKSKGASCYASHKSKAAESNDTQASKANAASLSSPAFRHKTKNPASKAFAVVDSSSALQKKSSVN